LARNLNSDFNAVWVQTIMETIQRMAPDGSPLAILAQQVAEVTNLIIAEKSVGVLGGNLLSAATIEQGVPKVKLRHQQVQITICPSMTCDGASLRAVPLENTSVNEMTSATLLKIGGVSSTELRPHYNGL
jgi:hypothetical protein